MNTSANGTDLRPDDDQAPEWLLLSSLSNEAKHLYGLLRMHEREQQPLDPVAVSLMMHGTESDLYRRLKELVAFGAISEGYMTRHDPPDGYTGPRSLEEFYALQGWEIR